ncbi:ATP-binding cassette domain-containing protein [Bradyrhizobium centrosematis]|uniref:ATP-binding cassette domain-containing protein n=1 Tax=Bradyrhizobium centrosematis TaxID=1300039 RepID=UPI00216A78A4|nr:ATP-binding cassette domain-containing protein [Bradyrhizobium centrosematis]MCS3762982.1 ABC-type proline/glycine betaine transport system ATPase subunit [Bradyrhizobium centrosematis]MCS3775649.1 ABC-type proline/glycine betaine transport system ATPase subunit [Bradyrhizobium centrosematis]
MPSTPTISYAHVTKRFGPLRAVDDVSLDVAEGEFLAIVGGSGSGKTTLLRLANRLIEADGGTITVGGEDVQNVDPVALRRRIGYVFQSGGLFPHLSVADNIGITPKLLGEPASAVAARPRRAGAGRRTHDMTEAILLADRIAVMREGKLLAQGTPAELSRSSDAYVLELLRTPRRQVERLNALLPQGGAA